MLSIYYLIMILICFLVNSYLGKECFQEEKLTHKAPEIGQNVYEKLFLLDFSTSKLLAPEFSHTAPQTFSK